MPAPNQHTSMQADDDMLDLVFDRIESFVCTEPVEKREPSNGENMKDLLDDVFELLEHFACNNSNNNDQEIPSMKGMIEQLLERIDDLAWISPLDAEQEPTDKDLLDAVFERVEDAACKHFDVRLLSSQANKDYLDNIFEQVESVACAHPKSQDIIEQRDQMPLESSMDLGNLLSLSQSNEDTVCTSQSLFKISEEGSEYFSAEESSSHSRRSNRVSSHSRVSVPSGPSEHLPRDIKRDPKIRTIRGSIHANISSKSVVDTMGQAIRTTGAHLETLIETLIEKYVSCLDTNASPAVDVKTSDKAVPLVFEFEESGIGKPTEVKTDEIVTENEGTHNCGSDLDSGHEASGVVSEKLVEVETQTRPSDFSVDHSKNVETTISNESVKPSPSTESLRSTKSSETLKPAKSKGSMSLKSGRSSPFSTASTESLRSAECSESLKPPTSNGSMKRKSGRSSPSSIAETRTGGTCDETDSNVEMQDLCNLSEKSSVEMKMVACVSIHTNSDRSNRTVPMETVEFMEVDDDGDGNNRTEEMESKQPFDESEDDNTIKKNLSEGRGGSETASTSSLTTDEEYMGLEVKDDVFVGAEDDTNSEMQLVRKTASVLDDYGVEEIPIIKTLPSTADDDKAQEGSKVKSFSNTSNFYSAIISYTKNSVSKEKWFEDQCNLALKTVLILMWISLSAMNANGQLRPSMEKKRMQIQKKLSGKEHVSRADVLSLLRKGYGVP